MKRNYLLILLSLISLVAGAAKEPKWLKKVKQCQVTVIAYDQKGEMHQSQGIFVNEKGSVVTEYDALKGAEKITIVDANGKEHNVTSISGANSMYNLCKVNIDLDPKETITFVESDSIPAAEQDVVYILSGSQADKKSSSVQDTIVKVDKFKEKYNYYTLASVVNERLAYSPVFSAEGKLLGLVQMPMKDGKNSFVIDCRFGSDMRITSMDAGNADLKSIHIQKKLPDTAGEASAYIFLLGKRDTVQYLKHIDAFIEKFPGNTFGYIQKAEIEIAQRKYAEAKSTYEQGLAQDSIDKGSLHYSMAGNIYRLNLTPGYETFEDWNMEKALTEAEQAYALEPLPLYLQSQAGTLYALKRYEDAYNKYIEVSKTNLRSPEIFMYAAQCKQMLKAGPEEILSLQDSAINSFEKPYPQEAANYFLMRGNNKAQMEKYREAVADFNEYEKLMAFNVTANFYYEREQLEMKSRMFSAALNDIDRAIKLAPQEPVFWAESAAINYRVNQIDDAITSAQEAIKVDDKFGDAYRILGVCYKQKGNTAEAVKCLKKAVELGDTLAQGILDKMK